MPMPMTMVAPSPIPWTEFRDEVLLLYSDGITEAENTSGKAFEESGLIDVVTKHATRDPGQIGAEILAAVEHFAGDARLADDLTALVMKRAG